MPMPLSVIVAFGAGKAMPWSVVQITSGVGEPLRLERVERRADAGLE
ncbi:MAG: hypothetical protein ACLPVY_26790 [Acidimicrobiia bacterium]